MHMKGEQRKGNMVAIRIIIFLIRLLNIAQGGVLDKRDTLQEQELRLKTCMFLSYN